MNIFYLLLIACLLAACSNGNRSTAAATSQSERAPSARATSTGDTLPTEAAALPSETPTLEPGQNPSFAPSLYAKDFADPTILRVGETYYGFATDDMEGHHIPAIRSTDLVNWEALGEALPELPEWADPQGETWAPGAIQVGKRFLLYYSPQEKESGTHCISVTTSDRPEGPYVDISSAPLTCNSTCDAAIVSSIDPYPFVDSDGQLYLLWTTGRDDVCHSVSGIWVQPLAADGLALTGARAQILTEDQYWEQGGVENPAMVKDGERYYLFYSANNWMSPSYAVGYAECEQVGGPCAKPQGAPVLAYDWSPPASSSVGSPASGPGGQTFFTSLDGTLWMAFHAWTAGKEGYPNGARSLRILRITFNEGKPVIHGPEEGP